MDLLLWSVPMIAYILRRVFQSLFFVFLASLMAFTVLVMLVPGGPNDKYALAKAQNITDEANYPDETIADLQEHYKLNNPWPLNFFVWLFDSNDTSYPGYNDQNMPVILHKGIDIQIGTLHIQGSGILTGDFGKETVGSSGAASGATPVSDIIGARWPNTLYLFVAVLVITLLISIPVGVIGAVRKGGFLDHTLMVASLGGMSIPPYMLSYLFILFLAVGLKSLHDGTGWGWIPWFPAGGWSTDTIWERLYHMVLPAAALAIPQIARIARHTRFALLDVMQKEYISTARAKGLGLRTIVFKHALRNSLVPIISQMALFVPLFVSAAAPVENAFEYSGLGREFYEAMGGGSLQRIDTTIILPILLIMVALITVSTLIADILYLVVDPRISYAARGKSG